MKNTLISFFMGPRKETLQTEQLYSLHALKKDKGNNSHCFLGLNPWLSDFTFLPRAPLHAERLPHLLVLSEVQTSPPVSLWYCSTPFFSSSYLLLINPPTRTQCFLLWSPHIWAAPEASKLQTFLEGPTIKTGF